jgi:hypothetical protein
MIEFVVEAGEISSIFYLVTKISLFPFTVLCFHTVNGNSFFRDFLSAAVA